MEIAPKAALDDSTTYHVEISATLQDLHGVSVSTPYHLVFATGPVLDSGALWGCVVDADGAKGQPKVALFRRDTVVDDDTVLLATPSYLVQTDTLGRFSLSNIRTGMYDVLAFLDSDNNNRLSSGTEQAFAPLEKRFRLDSIAGPLVLFAVSCDSARKRIASLTPLGPTVLLGQWEEGVRLDDTTLFYSTLAIQPLDTSDTAPTPPSITACVPVLRSTRFALLLDPGLHIASYRLIYPPQLQIRATARTDSLHDSLTHDTPLLDTLRFNGTTAPDTTPPSPLMLAPQGLTSLEPSLWIAWSEPVRAAVPTWHLVDTLGDTVVLHVDTSFADTTEFALPGRLPPGGVYALAISDSSFVDLSGNPFSDTADSPGVRIAFGTLPAEKLCLSLAGGSPCLEPDDRRIWQYLPFGTNRPYLCNDSSGHFRFDSIPASKGSVSFFLDTNGDREHTRGRVFPWRAPEPRTAFPDTLEARARWDIEGIILPECDPCPPLPSVPPDSVSAGADTAATRNSD
jgi:hypothetical protein